MTGEPEPSPRSRALAFAKAGSSAVISQAFAILLLPFLFRAYSPADFGWWAMLQAGILATASLSILRYDLAIVTEVDSQRAGKLFWGCLGLGGLAAVTVGLLAGWWAWSDNPAFWRPGTLALCAAWLLPAVLQQPLTAWLLREGRFGAVSASIVATTAGANAGQLLMAVWSPDFRGLIAGSAIGAGFGMALAAGFCAVALPRWAGPANLMSLFYAHRRFVAFSVPFTLLSLARERAPVLILAAFGTPAQIGAYSQAWRLVHIPSGLASSALRPVVFHAAARQGMQSISGLVQQLVAGMSLLAAPWLGVVMAKPEMLFAFVLGEAWSEAGIYAAILAIPALLFMLTNWFDRLLDVAKRQDANLKLEVVASVLSVGGFALALWAGVSLEDASFVQSVALSASYLIVLFVAYRICGFPLKSLLRVLSGAVALGAGAWALTIGAAGWAGDPVGLGVGAAFAILINVVIVVRLVKPMVAAIAGAK